MALNLLNLGNRESTRTSRELKTPLLAVPFVVHRPWLPTRGLLYSMFLHQVFFLAAVKVPWSYWLPSELPATPYEVTMIQNNEPLVLPDLKPYEVSVPPISGGASQGKSGGGSGKLGAPAGRPFKGVVHKGLQVIVSNPEHADNYVQTIRQPEIIHAPKLPFPLSLPNIIAIKPRVPLPAAPSLEGLRSERAGVVLHKLAETADALAVAPPVELAGQTPKLALPVVSPLPPAPGDQPDVEHGSVPLPSPPALPAFPVRSNDRNLLVLTAIPAMVPASGIVPPGELHGAFAVSPTTPPSSPPGPSGMAIGSNKEGSRTGSGGTSNVAKSGSGPGAGTGTGTSGTKNGSGAIGKGPLHSGLGTGSGNKGAGKGSGGNGGRGVTLGSGSGDGPGSTTTPAAGNGPGGPFPGISIEGGTAAAPVMASGGLSVRTPGTYALTIVGSGASGGGLKDYGVFHNEPVYTIYVDVAGSGAWTLQYAAIHVAASAGERPSLVTPPYPVEKHAPDYPVELVSLYEGRLIVMEGVIDTEGKVQNLSIVQSPHPKLTQALTEALKKCTFGAAEAGGKAVAIKFLLGVPIVQ